MKPHDYICTACTRGKIKQKCEAGIHHHWEEVDCSCVEYHDGQAFPDYGCEVCRGDGVLPPKRCEDCRDTMTVMVDCDACNGTGYLDEEDDASR